MCNKKEKQFFSDRPGNVMVFFCPARVFNSDEDFPLLCWDLLRWRAEGESIWEDRNMKSGKAESRVENSKWH